MTPLTASDVNLTQGSTYPARVALDAGDQLWFQVQDSEEGTLTVQVETDQGNTQTITVGAGEQEALRATETGTYDLNLSWTPGGSATGQVTIQDVPGPLNSLMELLTSYANTVTTNGSSHVVYNWAYSEPGLASPSDQVGFNAGDVAAAAYWPLWSDTTTFQPPDGTDPATWAAELSAAYAKLVSASPDLKSIGYANVIGVSFLQQPFDQFVADVQSDLETAYTNAYGAAPPASGQPASTPQDVVYQLLSQADTERTVLYSALSDNNADSLPQWVQEYIDEIQDNSSVQDLESNIVADQGAQIGNLTFNISSEALSTDQLIGEGAADASLSALSAITGLESLGFPVLGALVTSVGESLANDFIDQAGVPSYTNITVPVQPITTAIVGSAELEGLVADIKGAAGQEWTNILDALQSTTFAQTYMSNYGLLNALGGINAQSNVLLPNPTPTPTPTPTPPLAPQGAADGLLNQIAASTLIPAVFNWEPTSPAGFTPADGRTTDVSIGQPTVSTDDLQGAWGVATGDFIGSNPGLAISDSGTNQVTILPGNGDGTFRTPTVVTLGNNQSGPKGIVAGDFAGNGQTDIAVADYNTSDISVLMNDGNGTFTTDSYSLNGQNSDGPDNARGIAMGDLYGGSLPDLAVASYDLSETVSILQNEGNGTFAQPVQNITLSGAAATGRHRGRPLHRQRARRPGRRQPGLRQRDHLAEPGPRQLHAEKLRPGRGRHPRGDHRRRPQRRRQR